MGQMLDMVPNHMGVLGADNAWWMDVLENGPASAYADFFDIDWAPLDPDLAGKVLVPVLGDHYGAVLERGELRARVRARTPARSRCATTSTGFRSTRASTRRCSSTRPLALDPEALDADARGAFLRLVAAFASSAAARPHRARGAWPSAPATRKCTRPRLARLAAPPAPGGGDRARGRAASTAAPATARASTRCTSCSSARPTASPTGASPRTRSTTGASSTSTTSPRCAWRTTRRSRRRIASCSGSRRRAASTACASTIRTGSTIRRTTSGACRSATPTAPASPARRSMPHARDRSTWWSRRSSRRTSSLPESWPVHGTTGYRFANVVNGLFVDTAAALACRPHLAGLRRATRRSTSTRLPIAGKRAILRGALAGELTVLGEPAAAHRARRPPHARLHARTRCARRWPKWSRASRSTAPTSPNAPPAQDRRYIDWAIGRAQRRSLRGRREHLRLRARRAARASPRRRLRDPGCGVSRRSPCSFQQFTAPVTAKGVEDTSFYVFNRLISLNDVGRRPGPLRHDPSRRSTAPPPTAPRNGRTPCSRPPRTTTSARRTCARAST